MEKDLKEELKELRTIISGLENDIDKIKSLATELECALISLEDVLDGIENTIEEKDKQNG